MISNLTKILRDEYYEMRRKGLEDGMSTEQAARISGLTPSEIEQLAAEKDGLA